MPDTNGHNNGGDNERLNDLERVTESLAKANRELLTAQVLMHERQNHFDVNLNQLIESQKQLNESQKRTDAQIAALTASQKDAGERVDKLVSAIGELVRRMPPQA